MNLSTLADRTTSSAVLNTYTTLGIKPPKTLTDAHARAQVVAEGINSKSYAPGDLELAVAEAIVAGRRPCDDAEVQAIVTWQALSTNHGLSESVAAASAETMRTACLTNLDTIVSHWAKPFDKAAADLTASHQRIGNIALNDTSTILAKGGDIAQVWAQAQDAHRTIDATLDGWSALMQFVRVPLNPEQRIFRLAALTLEQRTTLDNKATAWDVVCAGISLSLPTLAQYRDRLAAVQREQAVVDVVPEDLERSATRAWAAKVDAAKRAVVA